MFKGRVAFVFCLVLALVSCHETGESPYKNLTKESFADMYEPSFALNSHTIRRCIDTLMRADDKMFIADRRTRRYYKRHCPFIWISRNGVLGRADIALAYIRKAAECGLDTDELRLRQIADDMQKLRDLSVLEPDNGINKLMARVEYNLTRTYLRYSAGQRFGFVNPDDLYNTFEKCDSDTVTGRVKYSHLCDLRTQSPDSSFFATAISKAFNDSVGEFISSVQPSGALYDALKERLKSTATASERDKILCNIERCRWRQRGFKDFHSYEKYVLVNVPSFTLRAVKGAETLSMRVAVGTTDNKTPLLSSSIIRMDVNPQWIIPKSIAKGIVGRTGYMHAEGMFVYDKRRGKLPPEAGSYTKVMDSEQFIIQAGGPKNPLGRIIFRFNNNFSVFLHDTSSPWLFQRSTRALSHGCVRVEKPLELALFLLDGNDKVLQEKLKYSMTRPFVNDDDSLNTIRIDRKMLINNVGVKPAVPIFITYYTIFYDDEGKLVFFDDIYGYDDALNKELAPFNK